MKFHHIFLLASTIALVGVMAAERSVINGAKKIAHSFLESWGEGSDDGEDE